MSFLKDVPEGFSWKNKLFGTQQSNTLFKSAQQSQNSSTSGIKTNQKLFGTDGICSNQPVKNIFNIGQICKFDKFNEIRAVKQMRFCCRQNTGTQICMDPKCNTPLASCKKLKYCLCLGNRHKDCKKISLQKLATLVDLQVKNQENTLNQIWKMTLNLEKSINSMKQKVQKLLYYGNIENRQRHLISFIFNNSNYDQPLFKQNISGKHVEQLVDKLLTKQNSEYKQKQSKRILQSMSITTKNIEQFSKNIQYYLTVNFRPLQSEQKIIKTKSHKQKDQSSQIQKKDILQIVETFSLASLDRHSSLQLIFRASDHQFKAQAFHKHCDNIQDTFTLVKTEYDNYIGGFSHYEWNKPNNGQWVDDPGKQTFLLLFSQKIEKLLPITAQKMIRCSQTMGPCFGEDLMISDQCNINPSFCSFPHNYNTQGSKPYLKNQQTTKMFCGASQGSTFKVKDYEVFKVIYKE